MTGAPEDQPSTSLPTIRQVIESWLGFQLPGMPPMPQTLRNLDKVGAALLDLPSAHLEARAATVRGQSKRDEQLASAVTQAMRRHLGGASNEEVAAAIDGLVADYLEKRLRRSEVLKNAAEEIRQGQPEADAKGEVSDDWMAFFKGKVDQLGTEEARFLFGKVLAREVVQPGSFSKRALALLAEMSPEVAKLFEKLCNMSLAGFGDVRVVTIGQKNAGQNGLATYGLSFGNLNKLNEAGLIISDYHSYINSPAIAMGADFEIAGKLFGLRVHASKAAERTTPQSIIDGLGNLHGVALTVAGCELRPIVSLEPVDEYMKALAEDFARRGFELMRR